MIYQSGDVKPAARTKFILLDEDLDTILKPFPRLGSNWEKTGSLNAYWLDLEIQSMQMYTEDALSGTGPHRMTKERAAEVRAEINEIQKAIAAHTIATAITDFGGKAKFEGVAPGKRFIFGTFKAGSNSLSWHIPLELKAGTSPTLTLSNDNSITPTP